jgi:hypothetical protein
LVYLDYIYKAKLKALEENYIYNTKNTRGKIYILIVFIIVATNIGSKVRSRLRIRVKPLVRRDP